MTVRRISNQTGEAIRAAHQQWANGEIDAGEYQHIGDELLGRDRTHERIHRRRSWGSLIRQLISGVERA